MTIPCKALKSLADDHLIDCFRVAVQMNLELDFLIQLKTEIDQRQLAGLIQTIELSPQNVQTLTLNSQFKTS